MVAMVAILALVLVLVVLIIFMAKPSQPRLLVGQSPRDYGADADIEDHDIQEMIEARNERRRRLGRPEIGDDLERQVREPPRKPPAQYPPGNV
ncbi:MAG: hypothetical protein QOF37_2711 [Thermoleophilaceae bacterium]|jgi:hypothetical protein|nr:hypothetical protein [Thermoleophilaceae bacterium]